QKGISDLAEEGAVQKFIDPLVGEQLPVLGVVGELQFDVLVYRLQDEYKLQVQLERLPFQVARWPRDLQGRPVKELASVSRIYQDVEGNPVVLLEKEWDLQWLQRENPDVVFHMTALNPLDPESHLG
ncbi:MAG: hypothetical protein D6797_02200, partial [Bdellovibrio sp.]